MPKGADSESPVWAAVAQCLSWEQPKNVISRKRLQLTVRLQPHSWASSSAPVLPQLTWEEEEK